MSFATGLKTIVVATDLHGQSEAALEYARKLATNYGARIVLAHGLDPMEYADVDAVPGRVRRGLTEAAREVLDKIGGRPAAGRNSQPLRNSPGNGGADAGGCGPAVRSRTDCDRHGGNAGRRTGGCGRDRRTVGAAGAVPGDGSGGGLERGRTSTHSGRAGDAGHGAERGDAGCCGDGILAGTDLQASVAGDSCAHGGRGLGIS